jgi:hypothetical protein
VSSAWIKEDADLILGLCNEFFIYTEDNLSPGYAILKAITFTVTYLLTELSPS